MADIYEVVDNTFPEIKTQRLLLRRISETDSELIFEGLSHPEVTKYYGVNFNSLEATKTQMNWYKELEITGTGIWWAICSADNSRFYGASGFNNLNRKIATAEIGFWLLPKYWGKGITKEAAETISHYAFEKMKLRRIEAYVETENHNSKKVLERLGFFLERTMTDCEEKKGKFISLDVYVQLEK